MKINMSESEIQELLYMELQNLRTHICPNIHLHSWEADLIGATASGYVHEYEIKRSLSDFRADFLKLRKHKMMTVGKNTPNYFWYVCEGTLLPAKDIPSYAGLIYLVPMNRHFVIGYKKFKRTKIGMKVIKKAPLLHNTKITDKQIDYLTRGLMLRYWSQRLK